MIFVDFVKGPDWHFVDKKSEEKLLDSGRKRETYCSPHTYICNGIASDFLELFKSENIKNRRVSATFTDTFTKLREESGKRDIISDVYIGLSNQCIYSAKFEFDYYGSPFVFELKYPKYTVENGSERVIAGTLIVEFSDNDLKTLLFSKLKIVSNMDKDFDDKMQEVCGTNKQFMENQKNCMLYYVADASFKDIKKKYPNLSDAEYKQKLDIDLSRGYSDDTAAYLLTMTSSLERDKYIQLLKEHYGYEDVQLNRFTINNGEIHFFSK